MSRLLGEWWESLLATLPSVNPSPDGVPVRADGDQAGTRFLRHFNDRLRRFALLHVLVNIEARLLQPALGPSGDVSRDTAHVDGVLARCQADPLERRAPRIGAYHVYSHRVAARQLDHLLDRRLGTARAVGSDHDRVHARSLTQLRCRRAPSTTPRPDVPRFDERAAFRRVPRRSVTAPFTTNRQAGRRVGLGASFCNHCASDTLASAAFLRLVSPRSPSANVIALPRPGS